MPRASHIIANTLLALALFNPGIGQAAPGVEILKIVNDTSSVMHYRVLWPYENNNSILCPNAVEDCLVAVCAARTASYLQCSKHDKAFIVIPAKTTTKNARKMWVDQHGEISRTFSSRGYLGAFDEWCITMGIVYSAGAESAPGHSLPGTQCGFLPPPNLNCYISDNLNISYGSLADDNVDTAKADGALEVRCSAPATVSVYLVGPRTVDLGRGSELRASLMIDNKNLADGYSFKAGTATTTLHVKTVLNTSSPPSGGPFQGNAILMMTYQ